MMHYLENKYVPPCLDNRSINLSKNSGMTTKTFFLAFENFPLTSTARELQNDNNQNAKTWKQPSVTKHPREQILETSDYLIMKRVPPASNNYRSKLLWSSGTVCMILKILRLQNHFIFVSCQTKLLFDILYNSIIIIPTSQGYLNSQQYYWSEWYIQYIEVYIKTLISISIQVKVYIKTLISIKTKFNHFWYITCQLLKIKRMG